MDLVIMMRPNSGLLEKTNDCMHVLPSQSTPPRKTGQALNALATMALLVAALSACSDGDDGAVPTTSQTGATQFAYVANYDNDVVQAYSAGANGVLSPVGGPVAIGHHSHHVNVDRAGRFVYISNHDSNFVSGFRVNSDGTLSTISSGTPGSPVTDMTDPMNNEPHSSTFDRTGRFLYVVSGTAASTLKAFTVNGDGTLTPLAGQSFPVGTHAHNIIVDPNNRFLYIASEDSGNVYAFSLDSATGALTAVPGSPFAVGQVASAIVVDPSARFAYVANAENGVSAFAINADGSLTPLAPAATFAAGRQPHSAAVHPSGNFLYVANIESGDPTGTVHGYEIDQNTGALTPLPNSPYPTGGEPNFVLVHPDGGALYTANYTTNDVSRFTINTSTGELSLAGTAPFPQGASGVNGIGMTSF